MRVMILVFVLVVPAAGAAAQTIDLTPMQTLGYDAGVSLAAWKVNNPSQSGDWFSVDFNNDQDGSLIAGLWVDALNTGTTPVPNQIGYTGSNASGLPDLGTATLVTATSPTGDGFNDLAGYAVPCFDPGTDLHVVYQHAVGDTSVWMLSDTGSPMSGRSFFTTDSYTTAIPSIPNWRMGLAGWAGPVEGTLLINGSSSATVENLDDVCLTFTACAPGVQSQLYLCAPLFLGPLLPQAFTVTGGLLGGPCSNQWTLCTTLTCADTTGGPFGFCALYLDPCNLKPNGKPTARVSTQANLTIDLADACVGCFGIKDDGIADFYVWKIQNPSGPGDWFNVSHGSPLAASGVNTLTGVSLSSWDFCGTGPCWAEVGIYAENPTLPHTPDVANGKLAIAANPCMAPGMTGAFHFYDTPDIPASTTQRYHVAANWGVGDSCIWIGSDTDGTDSPCGTPIPNAGTCSGFSTNSYATAALGVSYANWLMRIDWK